ncbi:MAG: DUF1648 domain-containing protein [Calditrichaeota bacterium]|nr:MAG: DUF1648 domain-containing protein [Calditrichota bacterium]
MTQPRCSVPKTGMDYFLEIAAGLLIISLWGLIALNYNRLPDTIPVHFSFGLQPDAYGSKSLIWTIPVVGTLLFLMFTILSRYPHTFNYPVTITEENIERIYRFAVRFVRVLNLLLALLMTSLFYLQIFFTLGNTVYPFMRIIVWGCVFLILFLVIYFMVRIFKMA